MATLVGDAIEGHTLTLLVRFFRKVRFVAGGFYSFGLPPWEKGVSFCMYVNTIERRRGQFLRFIYL